MTQAATLQSIDAALHAAFSGAGMASSGIYVPKGGDPDVDGVPVRLYFDRGIQQLGDFGQVVGFRDRIGLLLADVPLPAKGATVIFDGLTGTLESLDGQDQSIQHWIVRGTTHG